MLSPSPNQLADSPEILEDLRETFVRFNAAAKADPSVVERWRDDPLGVMLESASTDLAEKIDDEQRASANKMLSGILDEEPAEPPSRGPFAMKGAGGFKCFRCKAGLWSAMVLAIGGAIAISQGALIAPILAANVGFVPVIAAITGLSHGAVAAIAAGGGFTFGMFVEALCEEMGACK